MCHLSNGVVLQKPTRVHHLQKVSILHLLALPKSQILDHHSI